MVGNQTINSYRSLKTIICTMEDALWLGSFSLHVNDILWPTFEGKIHIVPSETFITLAKWEFMSEGKRHSSKLKLQYGGKFPLNSLNFTCDRKV